MTEKLTLGGLPATRQKYTPAFKAECVRQVAAGARQTDGARAQGVSPALLGRGPRPALEAAGPGRAERDESKRLRAECKRGERARAMLKKVVAGCRRRRSQPPPAAAATSSSRTARTRGPRRRSAACWPRVRPARRD